MFGPQRASASDSYIAGFSFGRMIWQNSPGMTEEQCQEIIADLTEKPTVDLAHYKSGVLAGFTETRERYRLGIYTKRHPTYYGLDGKLHHRGKYLPGETQRAMPEGETTMALVKKVQFKTDEREVHWAGAADLNETGTIFDILTITESTEKWYLEIMPRVGTIPEDLDHDSTLNGLENVDYEKTKVLLSFQRTRGREEDMTAAKDKIRQSGPMYNCYVSAVPLSKQRIFYDVSVLPKESELYQEPPKGQRVASPMQKQKARFTIPGMPASAQQVADGDFDPFLDSDELP